MLEFCFVLLAVASGEYARNPVGQSFISMNSYSAFITSWSGPGFTQQGRDWSGLCASGQAQSPIDINTKSADPTEYQVVTAANSTFQPFVFENLADAEPTVQFMGMYDVYFTFSGSLSQQVNSITTEQVMSGFFFHAPAGHTINGVTYPLGVKLGYATPSPDGMVAIGYQVYVLIMEGERNVALDQVMNQEPVDVRYFLPPGGVLDDYFFYVGSLDVPPCSENLPWVISNYIIEASADQIAYFKSLYINDLSFSNGKGNVRAVQPLNGRTVYHFIPTEDETRSSFLV